MAPSESGISSKRNEGTDFLQVSAWGWETYPSLWISPFPTKRGYLWILCVVPPEGSVGLLPLQCWGFLGLEL